MTRMFNALHLHARIRIAAKYHMNEDGLRL